MLLADRVAMVTGGAKGMGRGIALKFAEEGCSVAVADIDVEGANSTAAEVSKMGREGLAIQCDVADSKQVRNTVDKVIAKFGKVDILVNNAGGLPPSSSPIEDMPEEEWDKVVALNLKSDFLFCKLLVPHMKKRRYGKIINISSVGAFHPPSGGNYDSNSIHYNSAKAGILGFTYDLAASSARFNICVNAILPGPTATDFYRHMLESVPDKDAFFENLGKHIPLQRVGTPEDIARAALFLASELSSWVTGTTLIVSGGFPG